MNALLGSVIFGSFGLGLFSVEPEATTISYRQNSTSLSIEGNNFAGGTLGGYFSSATDLSSEGTLVLNASIPGVNPNSFFLIELYGGAEMRVVGIYEGNTADLAGSANLSGIGLTPIQEILGELSDIRGFQFTWVGDGQTATIALQGIRKITAEDIEKQRLADEAASLLAAGSSWAELPETLRSAYAHIYPTNAVSIAGADALNLMSPSILTAELVKGYVNYDNRWQAPQVPHGSISGATLVNFSSSWPGWGRVFPVVRIINPIQPAELVGFVQVIPVLSSGRFRGYYYSVSLIPEVNGVTTSGTQSNFGTGYEAVSIQGGEIRVIRPW